MVSAVSDKECLKTVDIIFYMTFSKAVYQTEAELLRSANNDFILKYLSLE